MSHLLRVAAALLLAWAVFLLLLRGWFMSDSGIMSPILHTAANGWAAANVALGIVLFQAANRPHRHLAVVYAALLLMALKTANDLYGILALPPHDALVVLVDLLLSVGILVGILRELPRTIDAARNAVG